MNILAITKARLRCLFSKMIFSKVDFGCHHRINGNSLQFFFIEMKDSLLLSSVCHRLKFALLFCSWDKQLNHSFPESMVKTTKQRKDQTCMAGPRKINLHLCPFLTMISTLWYKNTVNCLGTNTHKWLFHHSDRRRQKMLNKKMQIHLIIRVIFQAGLEVAYERHRVHWIPIKLHVLWVWSVHDLTKSFHSLFTDVDFLEHLFSGACELLSDFLELRELGLTAHTPVLFPSYRHSLVRAIYRLLLVKVLQTANPPS